jgi:hypothetical protein
MDITLEKRVEALAALPLETTEAVLKSELRACLAIDRDHVLAKLLVINVNSEQLVKMVLEIAREEYTD